MSIGRLGKTLLLGGGLAGTAYGIAKYKEVHTPAVLIFPPDETPPSRATQVANLAAGTKDNPFDLLIIGGGATGTGCALDAATRCGRYNAECCLFLSSTLAALQVTSLAQLGCVHMVL